jgi:hypothetical protein
LTTNYLSPFNDIIDSIYIFVITTFRVGLGLCLEIEILYLKIAFERKEKKNHFQAFLKSIFLPFLKEKNK